MSEEFLTLGVLGGMGPAATLDFLAKLQALTPVESEADHIRVIADINPQVPDLHTAGSEAGAVLAEMAGALRGAGAEVLAMPCNSAHAHADLIQHASGLPLIDMIGLGAEAAASDGILRCGVLGARGALRLYREYLAARGVGIVVLAPERQEAFMATLDRIKSGDRSPDLGETMRDHARDLVAAGAEAVIAGCTEIPLVLTQAQAGATLIDPTELLARSCVAVCLGLEPAPRAPT